MPTAGKQSCMFVFNQGGTKPRDVYVWDADKSKAACLLRNIAEAEWKHMVRVELSLPTTPCSYLGHEQRTQQRQHRGLAPPVSSQRGGRGGETRGERGRRGRPAAPTSSGTPTQSTNTREQTSNQRHTSRQSTTSQPGQQQRSSVQRSSGSQPLVGDVEQRWRGT